MQQNNKTNVKTPMISDQLKMFSRIVMKAHFIIVSNNVIFKKFYVES